MRSFVGSQPSQLLLKTVITIKELKRHGYKRIQRRYALSFLCVPSSSLRKSEISSGSLNVFSLEFYGELELYIYFVPCSIQTATFLRDNLEVHHTALSVLAVHQ